MSEQGWQVLVVDDHPIVCEGAGLTHYLIN